MIRIIYAMLTIEIKYLKLRLNNKNLLIKKNTI